MKEIKFPISARKREVKTNKPKEVVTPEASKNLKFTENRALPVRFGKKGITEYFEQALLVWKLLLASLVLDTLILSSEAHLPLSSSQIAFLSRMSLLLLLVSSAFLFREQILDGLDGLRSLQTKTSRIGLKNAKILFAIAAVVTVAEIVWHFGGFGVLALVFGAFVAFRALNAIRESLKELKERTKAFDRDQTLLLDSLNKQLFLTLTLPGICARAASLAAALSIVANGQPIQEWLPYGISALILLLALMPQEEHFIIRCKRCSRWTSRALKSRGHCPVCAREEFQIKQEVPTNATSSTARGTKPVPARKQDWVSQIKDLASKAKGADRKKLARTIQSAMSSRHR